MKHILSFGAGVNSTALLIELVKRNESLDEVVFADTGCELTQTYENVKQMEKWWGREIKVVRSEKGSLFDYYKERRTIPMRQFRDCTDKFKRIPIRKYLGKGERVEYIGIAADEARRASLQNRGKVTYVYPLIKWRMGRRECEESIEKEGLTVPPKSGCFCCPFQSARAWALLMRTEPGLFARARVLEEANRSYPKMALPFKGTLKQIETALKEQTQLEDFTFVKGCGLSLEEGCPSGYCFI